MEAAYICRFHGFDVLCVFWASSGTYSKPYSGIPCQKHDHVVEEAEAHEWNKVLHEKYFPAPVKSQNHKTIPKNKLLASEACPENARMYIFWKRKPLLGGP